MLSPGARWTFCAVNAEPVIVAETPLTSTVTTPAPTVPVTVIVSVADTNDSAGASIEIDGFPVTRCSMIVDWVPVTLPFASVQAIVT